MRKTRSIHGIAYRMGCGMVATVLLAGAAIYVLTGQWTAVAICFLSFGILSVWAALFVRALHQKLALFSEEICMQIDRMMDGEEEPRRLYDEDTLLDRIAFRLSRLYQSLQAAKKQSVSERADLQSLISDVSHQLKTPATNLKLVAGALLEQALSPEDRTEYLQILISQTGKLDFLMSAMIKSSRLETGVIMLVKKPAVLYETLAAAVGGVYTAAQEKRMELTVRCPETLRIPHDCKWTAEAFFNLLDNAVKYTPVGGTISVSVNRWEFYTKIEIADNGRGIPESRQAAIFGRFYREPEVHEIDGLGIGLYLTREIIARQGGYVQVSSEQGHGSVFSVFLPNEA